MTVASMTTFELVGCWRRCRIDAELNVPIDTMNITATRAAIGMRAKMPAVACRSRCAGAEAPLPEYLGA